MDYLTLAEATHTLRKITRSNVITDWQLVLQIIDYVNEVRSWVNKYDAAFNTIQFKYAKDAEKEERDQTAEELEQREAEHITLKLTEVVLAVPTPILSEEIVQSLYNGVDTKLLDIDDIDHLQKLGMYIPPK